MSNQAPKPTDWLRNQRKSAGEGVSTPPSCGPIEALDSKVEKFLQDHGVKYAPKSQIPIELIDEKASYNNQARDVPIVPDAVDRYAASLRRGDYLPPIIVFVAGNRVTIVDGNNRHAAHKRVGNKYVPGFVIAPDTPSEAIQLLTVASNRDNAEAVPVRWRKKQAAGLLGIGYSQEQACDAAGIKPSQLADYLALGRADARAKQHSIRHWTTKLAETTRIAVGRIPGDPVFFEAARVAVEYEIDADTAKRVLRDIKGLGSEIEQLKYVESFREEKKKERDAAGPKGKRRPGISSPKNDLSSAASKVLNVSIPNLTRQVLTEHDRDALVRYCELGAQKLVDIQIALEALTFGEEERRAG